MRQGFGGSTAIDGCFTQAWERLGLLQSVLEPSIAKAERQPDEIATIFFN